MNERERKKKQKRSLLFWFVFLLTVSVIATSILTTMLMDKYYFDASGAIDISPNNPLAQQEQQQETEAESEGSGEEIQVNTESGTVKPASTPKNPNFEASDAESGVWTTNTKVDIFKSSYTNKQGQMTVKSDDGDKVIAPGTSNSFVFKLANTGNVPLDFNLDIDAKTTDGYELPIKVRLYRHDNTWLLGDDDTWMFIPQLDGAEDNATMAAGSYFYYTLEWEWPFESDDSYDTATGNIAVDEDISLTLVIHTSAEESNGPNGGMGIRIPDTGDTTSLVIWGTIAALSLIIVIILIFVILIKDKDDDEDEENSTLEDKQIEENKKD